MLVISHAITGARLRPRKAALACSNAHRTGPSLHDFLGIAEWHISMHNPIMAKHPIMRNRVARRRIVKSDKFSSVPRAPESISSPQRSESTPRQLEIAVVPVVNSGVAGPESASVDKIRDMLFGNQMQDYDQRFANLEERFLQRFKEIESETGRNLNAFESNAKKQVDSLAAQLRDERDQRADADKEIERMLREQNQALEKRIRALSDQLSELDRNISDRLTREAQALRDEIHQKNTDLRHTIEKMFANLSNVKTDRTLLASLFVEVAKCLDQDLGSKGIKRGAAEAHGLSVGNIAS
jgi:hypothetical protein